MIGLGFNAYIHDTSAALVVDGRTTAFVEEERFSREKHTTKFPHSAIEYCLLTQGITIKDVDYVAFYWDPWEGFFRRIGQTILNLPRSIKPLFGHQLGNFKNMKGVENYFRDFYNFTGEFYHVNHYMAHAAQAAYRSPFETASILVVDGNGEIATTWLGKLTADGKIHKIKEVLFPHSIGLIWCTVTEYLGFTQNCDEGKIMGLSALGDLCLVDPFKEIFDYKGQGEYKIALQYFDYYKDRANWFSDLFVESFGKAREKGEELSIRHISLARALQVATEDILKMIVGDLIRMTGYKNLAYSGGVALNCVANGKLSKHKMVDNMFIPPAAYDAGAAEGAALYVYHMIYGNRIKHPQDSVYLGPEFSNEQIEKTLAKSSVFYRRCENVINETAAFLEKGKIVGWFQGRLESGPRALGNRSILADPRSAGMKDHLNSRVKHREWFRPFGPSVLEERADELFDTGGQKSPHMLFAFDIKQNWLDKIEGVRHVDDSSRIQTVNRGDNPRYYDLIKKFDELTGAPVILNTSFNVMGQPIVCSPKEAVECFKKTGIDILVIGDYICEKEK